MRRLHAKVGLSAAAVLVGCAVVAALFVRGESGAAALRRDPPPAPKAAAAKAQTKIIGISDPELIIESAAVQSKQLAAMRSIGVDSVRVEANWDWVQFGGPHSFDWADLDRTVHSIRAAGLTVDLVIDGCPPWAALPSVRGESYPQPASAARFAGWVRAVARRYTPDGVKYFEIWNEPNIVRFWKPRPNPDFYARMLEDSYRAIKAVDRTATVITGGLAPAHCTDTCATGIGMLTYLREVYAAGAGRFMDAVAVHPYCFPALPDTYEPWSAWSQMSLTSPSVRSTMRQYDDAREPIWITEFGVTHIGKAAKTADLKQALVIAKATPWIHAIYIYTGAWPNSPVAAALAEVH